MATAPRGRLIAQGLCGPVYRAIDTASGEAVAIKVLEHEAETVRHYFFNEQWLLARAQASGGHPHLSRLIASDVAAQPWSVATRYVDALRPRQVVQQHNPALVVQIIMHIGAALDYLHYQHPDHPVIHRDVKPDNILVDRQTGNAILIDLSIARSAYSQLQSEQVLGTLQYMAPEHYRGEENSTSDQFALALCAFFYLTGQPLLPAEGLGAQEATVQHIERWMDRYRAVLQRALRLHPATAAVLLRSLAQAPLERFPSCSALALALRQALRSDGVFLEAYPLQPAASPVQRSLRLPLTLALLLLLGLLITYLLIL